MVRVFVTAMMSYDDTMEGEQPLLKDIEEKYLPDINVEGIMDVHALSEKLNQCSV